MALDGVAVAQTSGGTPALVPLTGAAAWQRFAAWFAALPLT